MLIPRRACTVACTFAWKNIIIVSAVALLATRTPGELGTELLVPIEPGVMHYATMIPGENVEVTLNLADGQLDSNYTLADEDGNQLLQATYHRNGSFWLRFGDAFPAQPTFTVTSGGEFELCAHDDEHRYQMMLRPNGLSCVWTADMWWNDYHRLEFNKDGKLVAEPREIASAPRAEPGSSGNQAAAARSDETSTPCPSANASTAASLIPDSSIVIKSKSP